MVDPAGSVSGGGGGADAAVAGGGGEGDISPVDVGGGGPAVVVEPGGEGGWQGDEGLCSVDISILAEINSPLVGLEL